METLRQEIENARAAVNRAAGLVKGSKNAEVESWQLLEKLLYEARLESTWVAPQVVLALCWARLDQGADRAITERPK